MEFYRPNGDRVPNNTPVVPSNVVQTFTISVRTLQGVSEGAIRRQLQEKYEVCGVKITDAYTTTRKTCT